MRARVIGSMVLAAAALAGCRKGNKGPDLSTPQSAALAFLQALEGGDALTAKAACFGGPDDERVIEAMADVSGAMTRLGNSASARFGEEGRQLVDQSGPVKLSKNLDKAEVKMTPDKASVIPRGDVARTIYLKNIEGKWKVDVGMLTGGRDVSKELPRLRAFAQAARETAGEIDAGKVKTVDDTRQVLLNKIAPGTSRPVQAEPEPF